MTITQDADAPLVAVIGATGKQGGSVIKALSESDKPYRIRGFTRDASKPAAQDLTKQGVEMVAVDLKVGNEKQFHDGFNGATYAFAMTNPVIPWNKEKEIAEGKLLVDAARVARVKLLVWAGLPSIATNSSGKYTDVAPFEAKATVTQYAKDIGIPFVNVIPAGYFSNYVTLTPPRKLPDGTFILAGVQSPTGVRHLLDAAHDYGLFVRKAIESPGMAGSEVHAFTEAISNIDIAKQFSEGTGKTVNYVQITGEQLVAAIPIPDETFKHSILQMYMSNAEFGYYGGKSSDAVEEELARKPRTWAEFIKVTDWSQVLS